MSVSPSNYRSDSPPNARRRSVVIKHSHFIQKHGKVHHAFDPEKAPYPLSYDKDAIDLDVLDHICLTHLKGSVTFVNFEDGFPKNSLDLGCGTGSWVIDAAKEWPECKFTGFDLVNNQPTTSTLPAQVALRVRWVHGNFLTTKLPFDDDEFDHVHIRSLSRAVPENKWDYLFEEVLRVLQPGGVVEMIAEDLQFPTLPRWYTDFIRNDGEHLPSIHLPDGISRSLSLSSLHGLKSSITQHDHALLEELYHSVFKSRFINLQPTSLLPSYFVTYFRHVSISPVINFPMPTSSPIPSYESALRLRRSSELESVAFQRLSDTFTKVVPSLTKEGDGADPGNPSHAHPYYTSPADDTFIGSEAGMALLPMSCLMRADNLTLSLHLHRAYSTVLACQESMWEELMDRLRNREKQLRELGWNDDDLEGHHNRQRFDKLIERYRSDMHSRVALWQSVVSLLSWKLPAGDPMSRILPTDNSELFSANASTSPEIYESETEKPCRSMRIFVGFKATM